MRWLKPREQATGTTPATAVAPDAVAPAAAEAVVPAKALPAPGPSPEVIGSVPPGGGEGGTADGGGASSGALREIIRVLRAQRAAPIDYVRAFGAIGIRPDYMRFVMARCAASREPVEVAVRDLGLASGEQIAQALALAMGLAYVAPGIVDEVDVGRLRLDALRERASERAVPVAVDDDDNTVLVAVADQATLGGGQDLRSHWHPLPIETCIVSAETLSALWRRLYADTEAAVHAALAADRAHPDFGQVLLAAVLRHACYSHCSDVHFVPTPRAGYLRLRRDGLLRPWLPLDREAFGRLIGLLKNHGKVQDLVTSREAAYPPPPDLADRYGFRVQITVQVNGEDAVVRVLDRQSQVVEFDRLGFDASTDSLLRQWTGCSEGLVLVTGPTGSGKSTTLHAAMRLIDGMARSVRSIENPAELRDTRWHQSEIRSRPGDDSGAEAQAFAEYAKAFLRCDPDVVLVGEIRDLDTVRRALDLGNTGHLVFSTLHANSATRAIERLRELGVSMHALSAVLVGVLAQRLVPRLCPLCREPDESAATREALRVLGSSASTPFHARTGGCPSCHHTGYRGRRLLYEALKVDARTRQRIGEGASHVELQSALAGPGMWLRGLAMVAAGETTLDALRSVVGEEG